MSDHCLSPGMGSPAASPAAGVMKSCSESLNQRPSRLCTLGLSQELGPWRLASEDSGSLPVSRIQEQVLLTYPWAPEYLGPTKVGLSPAGVHHGRLCSAGCPLLLLQLKHWTLKSSLYASDVISLPFSDLLTVPKSLPVLRSPPAALLPRDPALALTVSPGQVAGSHVDWNLGKKGLVACSGGRPG